MMRFGPIQNSNSNALPNAENTLSGKSENGHESSFIEGVDHNDPSLEYRADKAMELIKGLIGRRVNEKFVKDIYSEAYLPITIMKNGVEEDQKSVFYQTLKTLIENELFSEAKLNTVANPEKSCELTASFVSNLIKKLTETKNSPSAGYTEKNSAEQLLKSLLQEGTSDRDNVSESLKKYVDSAMGESSMESGDSDIGSKPGKGHSMNFEDKTKEINDLSEREDVLEVLNELNKIPGLSPQNLEDNKNFSSSGLERGLEKGSDLSRLSATEFALPKDIFEYMFASESLAISKQRRNVNDKSPIYLLIDKSISMEKVMDVAKATALAIYKKSVMEGREFNFAFFDDSLHETFKITSESASEDVVKAFDYICNVKESGGTVIRNALSDLCKKVIGKGSGKDMRTNIILITDGEDQISTSDAKSMLAAANADLISILIEKSNPTLYDASSVYFTAHMENGNIKIKKSEAHEIPEETPEQLYFDI